MRFRASLWAPIILIGSVVAPLTAFAAIPFFGPVIPDAYNVCPASWGMLITVINNLISLLITLAITLVAPIMIAYSGYLFVINPVSSEGIGHAKQILWNTVLGIVIALSGWLIVNFVMSILYHPGDASWSTRWSDLIRGNANDMCLQQKGSAPGAGLNPAVPGSGVTGVTATGQTFSTALSNSPGSPCNPDTVLSAAQSAGYSITSNQASMLACVAQGESTCGQLGAPANLNFSWGKKVNGKASSAAGAFQVLLASNHACYENAPCRAAAGVSGQLNCQNAFDSDGMPIAGALLDKCTAAASNVSCSAAAAACLLSKQSFAAAYATDKYTIACQNQYGG